MSTSKALEIAKEEKWKLSENSHGFYERGDKLATELELELLYSSFNGLMEIVFRVNRGEEHWYFVIYASCVKVSNGITWEEFPLFFAYEIEALQDAIIFYHKNK